MKLRKLSGFEKTVLKAAKRVGGFALEHDTEFMGVGAGLGLVGGTIAASATADTRQAAGLTAASMAAGSAAGCGVRAALGFMGEKAGSRLWQDKLNFEQEQ